MNLIDIVVILVIVLIISSAVIYMVRAKKQGVKCIGCPLSCKCSTHNNDCKK